MKELNEIVITDIDDAVIIKANTGKRIKIENRKCFGISFCKNGKITYTHNGNTVISHKGNAVILPMGKSYELCNNSGGEFPLINFYCENDDFTDDFVSIPIVNPDLYLNDFEKMRKHLLVKENRLKTVSILYNIFHNLFLEISDSGGALSAAKKYITDNIRDSALSNTGIAEHLNISEIYLRKLFKSKYNTTPKQYVLDMRIELAKQRLSDSDESVSSIAESCGFSSVYHFCRAFKGKTAYTPLNYRETHRFAGI